MIEFTLYGPTKGTPHRQDVGLSLDRHDLLLVEMVERRCVDSFGFTGLDAGDRVWSLDRSEQALAEASPACA